MTEGDLGQLVSDVALASDTRRMMWTWVHNLTVPACLLVTTPLTIEFLDPHLKGLAKW